MLVFMSQDVNTVKTEANRYISRLAYYSLESSVLFCLSISSSVLDSSCSVDWSLGRALSILTSL